MDPTEPLGRLERWQRGILRTKPGNWFAMNISTRIDPSLLKMTRGRFSTGVAFPIVLMTAKGRRSGEPRTIPLVYFTDEGDVILIASSFGREKHPAWYLNITANPEVELLSGGARVRYRAAETEGEERSRLFGLAEQLYSGYGRYAESAGDREIPVLRLSPVA
ncbi:MAG: nitroreductase family deazaflavin-dependent oxidoreductase [Solirubrobacterales bacterium]